MTSADETFVFVTVGNICWVISLKHSCSSGSACSPSLPQLHDTGNIARGKDPPDVIEVSNKNAAICSTGESKGCQQLVALCLSVTAGARDAATATISLEEGVQIHL